MPYGKCWVCKAFGLNGLNPVSWQHLFLFHEQYFPCINEAVSCLTTNTMKYRLEYLWVEPLTLRLIDNLFSFQSYSRPIVPTLVLIIRNMCFLYHSLSVPQTSMLRNFGPLFLTLLLQFIEVCVYSLTHSSLKVQPQRFNQV